MATYVPVTSNGLGSKVPPEIYQKIWRLSLEPRVVPLQHHPLGFVQEREVWDGRDYNKPANVPAALLVCKESRQAVIDLYPYAFGLGEYLPITRFNFEIDTLHINHFGLKDHVRELLDLPEMQRIKKFAVQFIFRQAA